MAPERIIDAINAGGSTPGFHNVVRDSRLSFNYFRKVSVMFVIRQASRSNTFNVELEKIEPSVSRAWDGSTDLETVNTPQVHSSTSENVVNLSSDVQGLPEALVSDTETKPNDLSSHNGSEQVHAAPPPLPPSPRLSRRLSGSKGYSNILKDQLKYC